MVQPAVQVISLKNELVNAASGAIVTGLGTFTATLTVATASNAKAFTAAGIGAGIAALTFLSNSLRAWYTQRSA